MASTFQYGGPDRTALFAGYDLMTAGAGITGGTGTVYATSVYQIGDLIYTNIFIDVTGLNSAATGDIIGKQTTADCHLGQITTAINGTIVGGMMTCWEVPATGDLDIDLYAATESTGTEDAAISGLVETALLAAGGNWAAGTAKGLTALPAADKYLYLTSGGAGADATYTTGQFLIQLIGTP